MSEERDFWLNYLQETGMGLVDSVSAEVTRTLSQQIAKGIVNKFQSTVTQKQQPNQQQQLFQKKPGSVSVGELRENLTWAYGGRGQNAVPFELSAETDCFQYSDMLTALYPGEYFVVKFLVIDVGVGGNFNHAIEILLVDEHGESGWVLTFASGKDEIQQGGLKLNNSYDKDKYAVSSYLPGRLNTAVLVYIAEKNEIRLYLNNEWITSWICINSPGPRVIKTRVVGMRVGFFG